MTAALLFLAAYTAASIALGVWLRVGEFTGFNDRTPRK